MFFRVFRVFRGYVFRDGTTEYAEYTEQSTKRPSASTTAPGQLLFDFASGSRDNLRFADSSLINESVSDDREAG